MRIDVLTLFPEIFEMFFNWSIIGRAVKKNLVNLNCINIRDFSNDKHKKVDDYSYGGGPGMVMKPEPIYNALKTIKEKSSKVIYLSPKGKVYNQEMADSFSKEKHLIMLCGHYEGIDNRIVENYIDMEVSIGDYVLTGGEVPAMVLIDSIIRLVPGVLGSEQSFKEESHYSKLLEYPQYTRPKVFNNYSVPEILLSGNHKKIEEWRKYQALKTTYLNRKDLIKKEGLSQKEEEMLIKIKAELNHKSQL